MPVPPLPLSALHHNLLRILVIRTIVLSLQLFALGWARLNEIDGIAFTTIFYILVALFVITGLSFIRLRQARALTELELFSQLWIDIIGLTLLLYFSGGSTNPFVSYYLIPLVISAATLPWRYTIFIALGSLCAYSYLLFDFQPLEALAPSSAHEAHSAHAHHSSHSTGGFDLHVLGMWANFVVSCFLITWFIVKMSHTLKQQESELNQLREDDLRNEQVLAVATLAAGTAHELGTPLSTMKVVCRELLNDNPQNREDLELLLEQIKLCQEKLQQLSHNASLDTASPPEDLRTFIKKLLLDWHLLRQEVSLDIHWRDSDPALSICPPRTLQQSVINLLDNAADASPERLDVEIQWDEQTLNISIRDYGQGIPENMMNELGQAFVTSKQDGLGIGLLLTHATITHFGGYVRQFNANPGTLTQISLPLAPLYNPALHTAESVQ